MDTTAELLWFSFLVIHHRWRLISNTRRRMARAGHGMAYGVRFNSSDLPRSRSSLGACSSYAPYRMTQVTRSRCCHFHPINEHRSRSAYRVLNTLALVSNVHSRFIHRTHVSPQASYRIACSTSYGTYFYYHYFSKLFLFLSSSEVSLHLLPQGFACIHLFRCCFYRLICCPPLSFFSSPHPQPEAHTIDT